MPRLSRLSLLLLLPLLAGPARAAGPALEITATDPGPAARLGNGQSFSVRIAYRSDQPLRFELQTFDGTEQRRDMNNPKPLYAAGSGEAIAWIAFRRAAWIDRIQVVALSADWRPLGQAGMAVDLRWTGEAQAGRPSRRPAWVEALNREQQSAASQAMAAAPGDDDRGLWIISLGFGAMLGYLLLQPLVAFRWSGRWRLAGLAPLVLTLPLAAYTLTALAAGSNLWPLAALFLTPVAFVYLLLLASLRLLLGGPQAV